MRAAGLKLSLFGVAVWWTVRNCGRCALPQRPVLRAPHWARETTPGGRAAAVDDAPALTSRRVDRGNSRAKGTPAGRRS